MTEISNAYLILALFLPRITLLAMYLNAQIPLNPTPFVLDVFLSVLMPRIMVLILIAVTYGFGVWFWVHAVFAVLAYSGGTVTITNKSSK